MSLEDALKKAGVLRDQEDQTDTSTPQGPDTQAVPRSLPGRALAGAEKVLGAPASFMTKHFYGPLLEAMSPDEVRKERLKQLLQEPRNVYPGEAIGTVTDYLEPHGSAFSSPSEFAKAGARFVADVALDPLSYVGIGEETNLGKLARKIAAAKSEGETVSLGSKVAQEAGKAVGRTPSASLIKDFPAPVKGLAEQARAGQRALISYGGVPIVEGAPVFEAFDKITAPIRRLQIAQQAGRTFNRLFKTTTDNPEYDKLVSQFKDLAQYRAGLKVQDAQYMEGALDNLSKQLGKPREDINKIVTSLIEEGPHSKYISDLNAANKVPKPTPESIRAATSNLSDDEVQRIVAGLMNKTGHVEELAPADFPVQGKRFAATSPLTDQLKAGKSGSIPYVIEKHGKVLLGDIGATHMNTFGVETGDVVDAITSGKMKGMGRINVKNGSVLSGDRYDNYLVGEGHSYLRKALKEYGVKLKGDINFGVQPTFKSKAEQALATKSPQDFTTQFLERAGSGAPNRDSYFHLEAAKVLSHLAENPQDFKAGMRDIKNGNKQSFTDVLHFLDDNLNPSGDISEFGGFSHPVLQKAAAAFDQNKLPDQETLSQLTSMIREHLPGSLEQSLSEAFGGNQNKLAEQVRKIIRVPKELTGPMGEGKLGPLEGVDFAQKENPGLINEVKQIQGQELINSKPATAPEAKNYNWLGKMISFAKQNPGAIKASDNVLLSNEGRPFTDTLARLEAITENNKLGTFDPNVGKALDKAVRATLVNGYQADLKNPESTLGAASEMLQDVIDIRDKLRIGRNETPFPFQGNDVANSLITKIKQAMMDIYPTKIPDNTLSDAQMEDKISNIMRGVPIEFNGKRYGKNVDLLTREDLQDALKARGVVTGEKTREQMNLFEKMATDYPNLFNTSSRYITNKEGKNVSFLRYMGLNSRAMVAPGLGVTSPQELLSFAQKTLGKLPREAVDWINGIIKLNPETRQQVARQYNYALNALGFKIERGLLTSQWPEIYKQLKDAYFFKPGSNPELIDKLGELEDLISKTYGVPKMSRDPLMQMLNEDKMPQYLVAQLQDAIKGYSKFKLGGDALQAENVTPIGQASEHIIENLLGRDVNTLLPPSNIMKKVLTKDPQQVYSDYLKWLSAHEHGHRFLLGNKDIYTSFLPKNMQDDYESIFRNDVMNQNSEILHYSDTHSIHENIANANGFYLTFPKIMKDFAPKKFDFFRKLYTPGTSLEPAEAISLKDFMTKLSETNPQAASDFYRLHPAEIQAQTLRSYNAPISGNPTIDRIANMIKEKQARQLMIEQTSGVKVIPLTADIDYIAHVMTPEARDAIRENLQKSGALPRGVTTRDFNTKLANAARREFSQVKPEVADQWAEKGIITKRLAGALKGKNGLDHLDELLDKGTITEEEFSNAVHTLTVDEVNQLASQGKLKITGNKPVGEFFHTDPVYSSTVRGIRGERARTAAEFYSELINRGIGLPESQAPEGWTAVRQPELEGFKFEPEVARHLNNQYRFAESKTEPNLFLNLFDKVQNAWKSWTLGIFPAYHTRNFVGNMWNNWLAGVNDLRVYKLAGMAQSGQRFIMKDGLGKMWTSEELVQKAKELGVLDRGWVGADIQRSISDQLQKGSFISPGPNNKIVQAGFKVGRVIENNARMAHFIDRLQKGFTPAEAAVSVKKYLFDYGELTDFEKKVMKRLFPFYTWTRKNVPLQIQHLITQPGKFSVPFKANNELEAGVPRPNEKYLPQWMIENFPNRIRYNPKNGTYEYFLLNSWLPAYDIVKLFDLHDVAASMLTPLPKELLQQAFNYDFFMKRQIERIPGEKERFLGMDVPTRISHAAKTIRLLTEIDKITSSDRDLVNKITSITTGKTYPYDPEKAFTMNKVRVDDEIQQLRSALYREARKPGGGSQKEIDRIVALIDEKAKEY